MTEHVYATTDPTIVAAYQATSDAFNDMGRQCREDAEKLGKNKGALIVRGVFGSGRVVGLGPDDPADPPQGWQYVKTRDRLEPRRGKAGDDARRWLADHQPPDVRAVLAEHGLPTHARRENVISSPALFEHDGTVWALFRGEPQGVCTWEQRRLSEFHAAYEALESAEQTAGVAA